MIRSPSFAVPPTFLGIDPGDRGAPICIAGIPLDIGTTNRSGARFGPAAIRAASRMLADGDHPQHWVNAGSLPVADIGNFAIALGDIPRSLALIEEQAARIEHLVALGGDHSITLSLLRALAKKRPPLAVIHFDAHPDTWPDDFGQAFGHGSVFFHAIQERLIEPRSMVQIGVRSPVARAVHDWTAERGVRTIPRRRCMKQAPSPSPKPFAGLSVRLAFILASISMSSIPPSRRGRERRRSAALRRGRRWRFCDGCEG